MHMEVPNCSGNSFADADYESEGVPDFDEIQDISTSEEESSAEIFFVEYEWMEREESYEEEYMLELDVEELARQCVQALGREAMQKDLDRIEKEFNLVTNELEELEEVAEGSQLNPYAPEFIPNNASFQ